MDMAPNAPSVVVDPAERGPVGSIAERARALLPRSWAGEDIGDLVSDLLQEALEHRDVDGECAARFLGGANATFRRDHQGAIEWASTLVERAHSAGLFLWESRGRNVLSRAYLATGEEALGIEELVTAEVLTDGQADPSGELVAAVNGIAATYMLLGLYEDSERLYERLASMLELVGDDWSHHVQDYNRLLNGATWTLALEQVGASDQAQQRLRQARAHAPRDRPDGIRSPIEGDIDVDLALLTLFAEISCHEVSVADAQARLARLTTDHEAESESFVHIALALRLTEMGRLDEARDEVDAGFEDLARTDIEQVQLALRWARTRVAVLNEPDHPGLQEAWGYAQLLTDKAWELRLRRRDAVLDRLHIRRLRSDHDRVQRASLEDPLTGVANRRRLDRERAALERSTGVGWVAVLFVDLDDFKSVNDHLGHEVGDEVLRHVADLLRRSVRSQDVLGRFGGDEYVIVAHTCDPEQAQAIGERIVSTVRTHHWEDLHPGLSVSLSAGVAVTDHAYGQLFTAADDALYAAKHAGRDRLVLHRVDGEHLAPSAAVTP